MKARITCLMCIAVLCHCFRSSAAAPLDVLHLKNGGTVRGTIVELAPDSTVHIRMSDGTVRVYTAAAVEQITKEPGGESPMDTSAAPFAFVYYGGVSIPKEDLAAAVGAKAGGAQTGFGLGADARYAFNPSYAWMGSLHLSFNGMAANSSVEGYNVTTSTGSWVFLCILNGLKLTGAFSPGIAMFCYAQAGLLSTTMPRIIITTSNQRLSQEKAGATSFAYGYGIGLTIHHFELCVRYFAGKPEYDITVSGSGVTTTRTYTQPVSCVFITGGYRF